MPTNIDRHQVQRLCEEGAQLIEVLPAGVYETNICRARSISR